MKHIPFRFLSSLLLFTFFISACGAVSISDPKNAIPPNADLLIKFDENGVATLRGNIGASGFDVIRTKITVNLNIPLQVGNIQAYLDIPFVMNPKGEMSSSLISKTTILEYLQSHPGGAISKAFPAPYYVEVSFVKNGNVFEVVSIQEAKEEFGFFKREAKIENLLDPSGVLIGNIQYVSQLEGEKIWSIETPISAQGVTVYVVLPFYSPASLEYTGISYDQVEVHFTQNGQTLIVNQIIASK